MSKNRAYLSLSLILIALIISVYNYATSGNANIFMVTPIIALLLINLPIYLKIFLENYSNDTLSKIFKYSGLLLLFYSFISVAIKIISKYTILITKQ